MKKTKMFLVCMLMAVMVFTLAACGSSNQEAGGNEEVSEDQSVSEPESEEPDASRQEAEEASSEPEEADSEMKAQEASKPEASEELSAEGEIGAAMETVPVDSPEEEAPKETAYGSGRTLVTATDGDGIYDLEFEDGVLTVAYYEDYEGKGGWGGDSSMGIEKCRFYGMTVEEAVESLEGMGFKAEIK